LKPGVEIGSSDKAREPLVLRFADNRLLPLLFGEYDRNLARIEESLGVRVSSRGNRVSISGSSDAADVARAALNALYRRLERGLPVDAAEVDAAIRLASAKTAETGVGSNDDELVIRTPKRHITPRSPGQAGYMRALADGQMVFGLGPAGTGKTYLAVATAAAMLIAGRVDRIILSRPAVEAGERLGFLPGDLREKIDPYLAPLYDALYDMLPAEQVVNRLNSGEIEVAPLAFMRGRTLSHAYVILDEAQNATRIQMKMFLTRLGEGSRMAITGDPSQIDLPSGSVPGLTHAVKTLENIDGVRVVRFTDADVARHSLVTRIVQAYEEDERQRSAGTAERKGE
jgi:phosphate starvation-inducible PhoH-like protein